MLQEVLWYSLLLELIDSETASESVRLGEEIRHKLFMIRDWLTFNAYRILRFSEADELCGDDPSLMHQLVETVLSVRSWLTKDDWACFDSWSKAYSLTSHSFSIAFHVELLNVGWKFKQSLTVRKNGSRGMPSDVIIVKPNQTKENWEVLSDILTMAEMLIYRFHTGEEGLHI